MRKLKILGLSILIPVIFRSQDSLKLLNHEIGFNTVSLIKQVISNNPTTTLPQLPYDFFYNLYYRDKIGIRLGTGINSSYTETEIQGQPYPRMTTKYTINIRTGISYNFVKVKRIAVNAFADYVRADTKDETVSTTTVQVFPNPSQRITTEATDKSLTEGAQAGIGVRVMLHKNVCLYTEAPFTYTKKVSNSIVSIEDTGTNTFSISTVRSSGFQFYIPTTIYLVLRF